MHNRIPQTNAAHNALCSAVCTRPGSRADYTPRIPTATTTLVTATGNGGDTSLIASVGSRLRFEGTLTPSIPSDKFRVLKDVSIVYAEDGRTAVDNMHVIQVRPSVKRRSDSPWRTLRNYDRVTYTATVRDWNRKPGGHLFVSIERPTLIRPQYNR